MLGIELVKNPSTNWGKERNKLKINTAHREILKLTNFESYYGPFMKRNPKMISARRQYMCDLLSWNASNPPDAINILQPTE
jgi:hypothetical protein